MKKLLLTALLLLTTNAHATIIDIEYLDRARIQVEENDEQGQWSAVGSYIHNAAPFTHRIKVASEDAGTYRHYERQAYESVSVTHINVEQSLAPPFMSEFNQFLEINIEDGLSPLLKIYEDVGYFARLTKHDDGTMVGSASISYTQLFASHWYDEITKTNYGQRIQYFGTFDIADFNSQEEFDYYKNETLHSILAKPFTIERSWFVASYSFKSGLQGDPCSSNCLARIPTQKIVRGETYINNVSVTQVNEPSILILLLTATLFVLRRRFK